MNLITLTLDDIFSKPRPVEAVEVLLDMAVGWDDYSLTLDADDARYAKFKEADGKYKPTRPDIAFHEWYTKATKRVRGLISRRFGDRPP